MRMEPRGEDRDDDRTASLGLLMLRLMGNKSQTLEDVRLAYSAPEPEDASEMTEEEMRAEMERMAAALGARRR